MLASDDPQVLSIRGRTLPGVDPTGTQLALPGDPTAKAVIVLDSTDVPADLGAVDVVFPLLHGPYGEDGTLQGLLELAGVPYVGSGVFASAASMDKHHMKQLLVAAGLPTPAFVVVRRGQPVPAAVRDLGLPVFVKPARGGSSIGITKANSVAEIESALALAHQHDPKALVEQAVNGREIECGVLVDELGVPQASVPAEIRLTAGHDYYDFEAKYLDDATEFDIPPDLPAKTIESIRSLAVQAFEALDCEGLARVDFFVQPDGSVCVNELNTMPGFTPASMFPRMWAATGVDYPALVDRLIKDALRRGPGLR